jgi:hypothetical protein
MTKPPIRACLHAPSWPVGWVKQLVELPEVDGCEARCLDGTLMSYARADIKNVVNLPKPNSGCYLRNSHPQLRTSNKRPRSLIVANEPLSLVPNDKARKRLRQSLLVTSDPGPPDHEDSLVVLWRSRYRLPNTTHSFDLFRASKAPGDQILLVARSHIHPKLALC